MKKLLSVLLALTLSSAALVACSGDAETTTAPGTDAPKVTTTAKPSTTTKVPETNEPEPEPPMTVPELDTTNATLINTIEGLGACKIYSIEKPTEFNGAVGVVFQLADPKGNLQNTLQKAIKDEGAFIVVKINDDAYGIRNYANSGYFFRCDVESAGATLLSGVSYDITLYFFNADKTMTHYTNTETLVSGVTTVNAPARTSQAVEAPAGLTDVAVDGASAASEGLNAWGDGAPANLFDGDTTTTKIGGGTEGSVTVTFSTTEAATVSYYTLYTGGDSSSYPDRNPSSWTLYGKVNGEWVVLSEVAADNATTVTGLEAADSTPFTYKVTAKNECTEYKIVFVTGGSFQLNEMVLHVG